jgi:hypothetical protein
MGLMFAAARAYGDGIYNPGAGGVGDAVRSTAPPGTNFLTATNPQSKSVDILTAINPQTGVVERVTARNQ